MIRHITLILVVFVATTTLGAADEASNAWSALSRGGHVAIIRHGNAPPGYGGDPPGFRFDDCKTQRNLDDRGRAQGRALGEAFRSHGVQVDEILSSPVCRCLDTARLMAVGTVETSWALLPDSGNTSVRFGQLKQLVSSWDGPGTLVLMTHAFTIAPLTGFNPQQAEVVVLKPDPGHPKGATVVGRIPPPQ